MPRLFQELIYELREAASDAVRYADGLSDAELRMLPMQNGDIYRALKNALTELGEGIKNLPEEVGQRHPNIDWRGMMGLRDIVAHQYYRLDIDRLAPVLREELSALIVAIDQEIEILSAETERLSSQTDPNAPF